jgi:hypothetical protein
MAMTKEDIRALERGERIPKPPDPHPEMTIWEAKERLDEAETEEDRDYWYDVWFDKMSDEVLKNLIESGALKAME